MQHIRKVIDNPIGRHSPLTSGDLTEEQRRAVGYFFTLLKAYDPDRFDQLYPDEKTLAVIKRTNARYIMDFTREKIETGFHELKLATQSNAAEFRFWKLDQIIGLVANGGNAEGNPAGIHKTFKPLALPDKSAQERAHKAGDRELNSMKALFD